MRPTVFGSIGEISTPGGKADQDWTKVMFDQKALSEGREGPFYIVYGILLKST